MDTPDSSTVFVKNAIEAAIKISLLGVMIVTTFSIIKPFIMPVAWGVIIAVAVEPFIGKLAERLGGRRKLISTLFALVVIAALVIPSVLLVSASIDTVQTLSAVVESESLSVPPPNAKVEEWPVIGPSVYKTWTLASSNLDAALHKFGPQLKEATFTLLGGVGGGLKSLFMFIISIAV